MHMKKYFRTTKVDRALRRSMLTNGGEAASILASPAERPIHPRHVVYLVLIVLLVPLATMRAQNADRIAHREVARRQAALPQGAKALARGKAAMQESNFTVAHEEFRTAVSYLPDAVTSGNSHDEAVDGFCKSGVKLAEQRIAEGKHAEAEFILRECLDNWPPVDLFGFRALSQGRPPTDET